MAEALLFGLAAYITYAVRSAILKWKAVDENIEKLITIEKAQKLVDDARKEL